MVLVRNRTVLTSFRRPAHFLLPRRCPKLASLLQVLPLLELLLAQVAARNGVAVAVYAKSEVLAGPTALTHLTDELGLRFGEALEHQKGQQEEANCPEGECCRCCECLR